MAHILPPSLQKIIDEFSKLPGIGPKSAERLAMHLLYSPHRKVSDFGDAVLALKHGIEFCQTCWHVSENSLCALCDDSQRDKATICVVEGVLDLVALEKTLEYKGVYHVFHGLLSPVDGIGPDRLKLYELEDRIKKAEKVSEVIIATNPSLEGEATALYIQRLLVPFEVKITRLARGLPAGASLEYADSITLGRALEGRQNF